MVEGEKYEGTPGLWELIVSKNPKDYTNDYYDNYARLMLKTNTLHRDNNPESNYPKSSKGQKWKRILKTIWGNRREEFLRESQKEKKEYEERFFDPGKYYYGKGVVFFFRAILTRCLTEYTYCLLAKKRVTRVLETN